MCTHIEKFLYAPFVSESVYIYIPEGCGTDVLSLKIECSDSTVIEEIQLLYTGTVLQVCNVDEPFWFMPGGNTVNMNPKVRKWLVDRNAMHMGPVGRNVLRPELAYVWVILKEGMSAEEHDFQLIMEDVPAGLQDLLYVVRLFSERS